MIRLAVRVDREHADVVLSELLELVPSGVEEVDAGDCVEFAVYGAPGELPGLPDVQAVAGGALVEVLTSEVPDDWHERWKAFHRPVLIAPARGDGAAAVPALHVRPPWAPPYGGNGGEAVGDGERTSAGVIEIVIDPGQAFGTGAHATTRLCLELLLARAGRAARRGPALDVGTGSGVLAIAASLLGFAPVLGVDNEAESVRAARENALVNGAVMSAERLDLRTHALPEPQPDEPLELMTANLLRPLLIEVSSRLHPAPRDLIAGGLLAEEADEVAAAFAERCGLRECERRHGGEWAALWLTSD